MNFILQPVQLDYTQWKQQRKTLIKQLNDYLLVLTEMEIVSFYLFLEKEIKRLIVSNTDSEILQSLHLCSILYYFQRNTDITHQYFSLICTKIKTADRLVANAISKTISWLAIDSNEYGQAFKELLDFAKKFVSSKTNKNDENANDLVYRSLVVLKRMRKPLAFEVIQIIFNNLSFFIKVASSEDNECQNLTLKLLRFQFTHVSEEDLRPKIPLFAEKSQKLWNSVNLKANKIYCSVSFLNFLLGLPSYDIFPDIESIVDKLLQIEHIDNVNDCNNNENNKNNETNENKEKENNLMNDTFFNTLNASFDLILKTIEKFGNDRFILTESEKKGKTSCFDKILELYFKKFRFIEDSLTILEKLVNNFPEQFPTEKFLQFFYLLISDSKLLKDIQSSWNSRAASQSGKNEAKLKKQKEDGEFFLKDEINSLFDSSSTSSSNNSKFEREMKTKKKKPFCPFSLLYLVLSKFPNIKIDIEKFSGCYTCKHYIMCTKICKDLLNTDCVKEYFKDPLNNNHDTTFMTTSLRIYQIYPEMFVTPSSTSASSKSSNSANSSLSGSENEFLKRLIYHLNLSSDFTFRKLILKTIAGFRNSNEAIETLIISSLIDDDEKNRLLAMSYLMPTPLLATHTNLIQYLSDSSFNVRRKGIKLISKIFNYNPLHFKPMIIDYLQTLFVLIITTTSVNDAANYASFLATFTKYCKDIFVELGQTIIAVCLKVVNSSIPDSYERQTINLQDQENTSSSSLSTSSLSNELLSDFSNAGIEEDSGSGNSQQIKQLQQQQILQQQLLQQLQMQQQLLMGKGSVEFFVDSSSPKSPIFPTSESLLSLTVSSDQSNNNGSNNIYNSNSNNFKNRKGKMPIDRRNSTVNSNMFNLLESMDWNKNHSERFMSKYSLGKLKMPELLMNEKRSLKEPNKAKLFLILHSNQINRRDAYLLKSISNLGSFCEPYLVEILAAYSHVFATRTQEDLLINAVKSLTKLSLSTYNGLNIRLRCPQMAAPLVQILSTTTNDKLAISIMQLFGSAFDSVDILMTQSLSSSSDLSAVMAHSPSFATDLAITNIMRYMGDPSLTTLKTFSLIVEGDPIYSAKFLPRIALVFHHMIRKGSEMVKNQAFQYLEIIASNTLKDFVPLLPLFLPEMEIFIKLDSCIHFCTLVSYFMKADFIMCSNKLYFLAVDAMFSANITLFKNLLTFVTMMIIHQHQPFDVLVKALESYNTAQLNTKTIPTIIRLIISIMQSIDISMFTSRLVIFALKLYRSQNANISEFLSALCVYGNYSIESVNNFFISNSIQYKFLDQLNEYMLSKDSLNSPSLSFNDKNIITNSNSNNNDLINNNNITPSINLNNIWSNNNTFMLNNGNNNGNCNNISCGNNWFNNQALFNMYNSSNYNSSNNSLRFTKPKFIKDYKIKFSIPRSFMRLQTEHFFIDMEYPNELHVTVWLKNLLRITITKSPSTSVRACSDYLNMRTKFVKKLFPVAFLSCWKKANVADRDHFSSIVDYVLHNHRNVNHIFFELIQLADKALIPMKVDLAKVAELSSSHQNTLFLIQKRLLSSSTASFYSTLAKTNSTASNTIVSSKIKSGTSATGVVSNSYTSIAANSNKCSSLNKNSSIANISQHTSEMATAATSASSTSPTGVAANANSNSINDNNENNNTNTNNNNIKTNSLTSKKDDEIVEKNDNKELTRMMINTCIKMGRHATARGILKLMEKNIGMMDYANWSGELGDWHKALDIYKSVDAPLSYIIHSLSNLNRYDAILEYESQYQEMNADDKMRVIDDFFWPYHNNHMEDKLNELVKVYEKNFNLTRILYMIFFYIYNENYPHAQELIGKAYRMLVKHRDEYIVGDQNQIEENQDTAELLVECQEVLNYKMKKSSSGQTTSFFLRRVKHFKRSRIIWERTIALRNIVVPIATNLQFYLKIISELRKAKYFSVIDFYFSPIMMYCTDPRMVIQSVKIQWDKGDKTNSRIFLEHLCRSFNRIPLDSPNFQNSSRNNFNCKKNIENKNDDDDYPNKKNLEFYSIIESSKITHLPYKISCFYKICNTNTFNSNEMYPNVKNYLLDKLAVNNMKDFWTKFDSKLDNNEKTEFLMEFCANFREFVSDAIHEAIEDDKKNSHYIACANRLVGDYLNIFDPSIGTQRMCLKHFKCALELEPDRPKLWRRWAYTNASLFSLENSCNSSNKANDNSNNNNNCDSIGMNNNINYNINKKLNNNMNNMNNNLNNNLHNNNFDNNFDNSFDNSIDDEIDNDMNENMNNQNINNNDNGSRLIHEYANNSIRAFLKLTELVPSDSLEFASQILSILSSSSEKVTSQFINLTLNPSVVIQVLPLITSKLDHPDKNVNIVIDRLLTTSGMRYFQEIYFALNLYIASKDEKSSTAKSIVDKIKPFNVEIAEDSDLFIDGMVRSALTWFEIWMHSIEEAVKYPSNSHQILTDLFESYDTPQCDLDELFVRLYDEVIQSCKRSYNIKNEQLIWSKLRTLYSSLKDRVNKLSAVFLSKISDRLCTKRGFFINAPGYHNNRIESLEPVLDVLETQQHPRCLTMNTKTGKKLKYLLKGNEDLRLDERLMQLFALINGILSHNESTKEGGVFISRYAVIPLTKSVGLIKWVTGADTMHQMVLENRTMLGISREVEGEIICQSTDINFIQLNALQRLEIFEEVTTKTKAQELFEAMWLKSPSAAVWLTRTQKFTVTSALMSMVGYLIGLGDRHPSNIMIQRETGNIVHIDFGESFDKAALRKQFPERVPFRLTRMIINSLEGSIETGLFTEFAMEIMKVLRESKATLTAQLTIFVEEPLTHFQKEGGENPERVIERCSRKLAGNEFGEEMSVTEQVKMLIGVASDPANYVRHYTGWCPFW